jgi:PEP-CTERM motif
LQLRPPNADPIYIGLQENGAPITTLATGDWRLATGDWRLATGDWRLATGDCTATLPSLTYGTFQSVTVTTTGTPPLTEPSLLTESISVSSAASGVLTIYVSELGQTAANFSALSSGFTSNLLLGNITSVVESTYVQNCGSNPCTAADAFSTSDLLSTTTFTGIGSTTITAPTPVGLTGPYVKTEVYVITATGAGAATDTINVVAVPEPATLGLLGTGIAGLGFLFRRGRNCSFA